MAKIIDQQEAQTWGYLFVSSTIAWSFNTFFTAFLLGFIGYTYYRAGGGRPGWHDVNAFVAEKRSLLSQEH